MSAKKFCCLITVTAMLFFGFPAMPFANVDQVPQLSQEELGLVFQNSESTWKEKPDFLKYLDEREMKETKGKVWRDVARPIVGGGMAAGGSIALDLAAGRDINWGNAAEAFVGAAYGTATGQLYTGGALETLVVAGVAAFTGMAGVEASQQILSQSLTYSPPSGGGGNCRSCHS